MAEERAIICKDCQAEIHERIQAAYTAIVGEDGTLGNGRMIDMRAVEDQDQQFYCPGCLRWLDISEIMRAIEDQPGTEPVKI